MRMIIQSLLVDLILTDLFKYYNQKVKISLIESIIIVCRPTLTNSKPWQLVKELLRKNWCLKSDAEIKCEEFLNS